MRKKALTILTVFMLLFSFIGIAEAAPTVNLNGNQLSLDVPPVVENGRTLVPLRAIFEALGANVYWHPDTNTIKALKGSTIITLQVDSTIAYVDYVEKTEVQLDTPVRVINGRTLVPLRFVSEALGAKVEWDGNNNIAYINTQKNNSNNNSKIDTSTSSNLPLFQKDISTFKVTKQGGFVHIKGDVKINSSVTYSYVEIKFNLFDSDGKQIGTAMDNITDVSPGTTWSFDAIGIAPNYSSFKLVQLRDHP